MSAYPIHSFSPDDCLLPPEIWTTPEPALKRIHVQGSPEALDLLEGLPALGLAVVGTRLPQARAVQYVRERIEDLRGGPWIILSGLARGIDAAAHEAALAAGLPTIAVLGCGLSQTYPPEHKFLRERILKAGGLIVSEFEHEERIFPSHFLQRNRLLAAWSCAVWVAQAPSRSGALNTARWAYEIGRDVYSTPSFPEDKAFAGNRRLLDDCHATAVWGTHSFGQSWLELSTWKKPPLTRGDLRTALRKHADSDAPLPENKDVSALVDVVRRFLQKGPPPSLEQLMDWGIQEGWDREKLFSCLQVAVDGRHLFQQGTQVSLPLPKVISLRPHTSL